VGVGVQRHAPATLPPGTNRYPSYKRLGCPQGRSEKYRLPPGFDSRTVRPVASCYTDWAIAAQPITLECILKNMMCECGLPSSDPDSPLWVWTTVIWSWQSLVSVDCRHLILAVLCECGLPSSDPGSPLWVWTAIVWLWQSPLHTALKGGTEAFPKILGTLSKWPPILEWPVILTTMCRFCARCMCTETQSCISGEKLQ